MARAKTLSRQEISDLNAFQCRSTQLSHYECEIEHPTCYTRLAIAYAGSVTQTNYHFAGNSRRGSPSNTSPAGHCPLLDITDTIASSST